QLWVADMTYIPTWAGFLYLAVVIDVFSRKVVGWSFSETMTAFLSMHRVRQGFVKARTAQANQIRGLLSKFGIVLPLGIRSISKRMPDIL
ncbi:integrase-like protein, partial [Nitrosomonas ureae]